MYLDNADKLYMDLYNIPTMYDYMVACAEDGENKNLSSLFHIAKCHTGELHEGGEGSERWNLEYCETEDERQQMIKDARIMDAIYRQIQREIKAKYVIECQECCYVWFMERKSKTVKELMEKGNKATTKCFCNGMLKAYTMDEWCKMRRIDLKEVTRWL